MKKADRHHAILDALGRQGRVDVTELAESCGVSDMTIRRDLEELERQQKCRRIHGGAVPALAGSHEPPFTVRRAHALDAKRAIAKGVVEHIDDGQTVILDIGTTTLEVARALRDRSNLTVLTPSMPIAGLLADQPGIRVISLGGIVRPGEHSMVGPLTELAIRQFRVDVCVLGIGGIDAQAGLTEFNLDDAAVKRVLIEQSSRLIVAADRSKLGTVAFAAVAPLDRVDVLVTDGEPDTPTLAQLKDAGIDVHTT